MPFILPFCKKLADAVYISTSLIYIITCHSKQVPLLPGYLHEFFTDLCIHFIKILRTCLIQFSSDCNGIIKHYYAYTRKYNYCHAYCCKEIFSILILLQLTCFLSQDNQLFCIYASGAASLPPSAKYCIHCCATFVV